MSAGGCRNDLRRFATNPQFLLKVYEADDSDGHHEDDDEDSNHNLREPRCEVIVSLAQEHRRSHRDKKVKLMQIGFCLYRASGGEGNRLTEQVGKTLRTFKETPFGTKPPSSTTIFTNLYPTGLLKLQA